MKTDEKFTGIQVVTGIEEIADLRQINIKALLKVASTIERMEKKWQKMGGKICVKRHFNMSIWSERNKRIGECNTAGCAIGTFIIFNKRAANEIKLSLIGDFDNDRKTINNKYKKYEWAQPIFADTYEDWTALKMAFDLPSYEATYYLFSGQEYPRNRKKDPLYVANRIRTYVKAIKNRLIDIENQAKSWAVA